MYIHDRIYGRIQIDEPVIQELIASAPMQRLRAIAQVGATHFIQPQRDVTRFEHSVGAWYLSSRYNRPVEEQIATLLHDTPHTAFSHVIDIVMKDENHAYHDRFTKQIILGSEIPAILAKYQIEIDKVLNKENYDLLENDLPDISYDRWDYFMHDGYSFGILPKATIKLFLRSVKEKDQRFYFEDARVASLFAIMFMNCSRLIWLDPTSVGAYYVLAQALQIALADNVITEQDIFQTDAVVLAKLHAANHPGITSALERLQPGKEFAYAKEAQAEFYGKNKPRVVDPWVEADGTLQRLSNIIPGLKDYFDDFRKQYAYVGVVQK